MIETPPPDAARHPAQHRPAPSDHSAREREKRVLAGVSQPTIDDGPAAGRNHRIQYP